MKASPNNPLGLKLGEEVRVHRICTVEYDKHGEKKLNYSEDLHFLAVVVGTVRRALGTYVGPEFYDSDEQGSLKVSKYVRLYEVKTTLADKPSLVHPDDIEVT